MDEDTNKPPEKNIILNLKLLFAQMQLHKKSACSTKELTKSFGWDDSDTFIQHDVQEFCRVLLDNIETKLKGTQYEDYIRNLFCGKMRKFVRGLNVEYESFNYDYFYDISLDVKNCQSLCDSFDYYLQTEKLEGDNQYQTDEYGKIDVELGTEFLEFPKVLYLHLRRFEYDPFTGSDEKINSLFMYPDCVDLSQYVLEKNRNPDLSYEYELYGVLVHSGTTISGHYYIFLRTSTSKKWYKFNDSYVTSASIREVFDANYGGPSNLFGFEQTDQVFSAYMLIYVAKDFADELYENVPNDLISPRIIELIERKENKEKIDITIYNKTALELNALNGSFSFVSRISNPLKISVKKGELNSNIYDLISDILMIPTNCFDLFSCTSDKLTSKVVNSPSYKTSQNSNFFMIRKEIEDDKYDTPVLIYFYFSNLKGPIRFLFTKYVDSIVYSNDFPKIVSSVRTFLKIPDSINLNIYQNFGITKTFSQVKESDVEPFISFSRGTILVFETENGEIIEQNTYVDLETDEKNYLYMINDQTKSFLDYYNLFKDTTEIKIIKEDNNYYIKYPPTITLEQFIKFIKIIFNENRDFLMFKNHDVNPIVEDVNAKISDVISEKVEIFFIDNDYLNCVNNFSLINLMISYDSITIAKKSQFLFSSRASVSDLIEHIRQTEVENINSNTNLRLMEIKKKKILKILDLGVEINELQNPLRIEVVPDDQIGSELITVSYNSQYMRKKNQPFLLKIVQDEVFHDTKQRIFNALKWEDKDMEYFGFKLVGNYGKNYTLKNEDKLSSLSKDFEALEITENEYELLCHSSQPAVHFYN